MYLIYSLTITHLEILITHHIHLSALRHNEIYYVLFDGPIVRQQTLEVIKIRLLLYVPLITAT